ncbi:MAG: hypothetical protein ACK5GJ_07655 [Planctomycetota bacterium]
MLIVRKMHLHYGPIALASLLIILGGVWQFWTASKDASVSGSTLPGLVVGSVAAGIILFELLLWPRKRLRRYKLGRTKFWVAYHLWLGLACGPLAFIHSGFRFGGAFSTILMILLLLVLASGVFGWIMQVVIPRWMLGNLPQETILNQIDDVSLLSALENRQMLTVALGGKPPNTGKLVMLEDQLATLRSGGSLPSMNLTRQAESHNKSNAIIVGAMQRRDPQRVSISNDLADDLTPADRAEIWKQYTLVIEPFLLRNAVSSGTQSVKRSPIRTLQKTQDWFKNFRESCSASAGPILDSLQGSVEQRLQFDAQRMAHAWLHRWIAFHAGISVTLGVLLIVHIIQSLRYM